MIVAVAADDPIQQPSPLAHACRVDQHAPRPPEDVELRDQPAHQPHPGALLSFRHVERGAASAAAHSSVSYGIDDDRLGKLARRARELAQHQHAALVVTRGDEFLRHEVHAVVQAADHAQFGRAIVLMHRIRLVVRGQQDDRRHGCWRRRIAR